MIQVFLEGRAYSIVLALRLPEGGTAQALAASEAVRALRATVQRPHQGVVFRIEATYVVAIQPSATDLYDRLLAAAEHLPEVGIEVVRSARLQDLFGPFANAGQRRLLA